MSNSSYEEKLLLYESLVASHPEVPRKGKTAPYTSINGHMFSMLSKDGRVGMRLSKEKRGEFNQKYEAGDFLNYGAVIREYSEITDSLLGKTDEVAPWFAASYEYTKSLKAKPTTKKKK